LVRGGGFRPASALGPDLDEGLVGGVFVWVWWGYPGGSGLQSTTYSTVDNNPSLNRPPHASNTDSPAAAPPSRRSAWPPPWTAALRNGTASRRNRPAAAPTPHLPCCSRPSRLAPRIQRSGTRPGCLQSSRGTGRGRRCCGRRCCGCRGCRALRRVRQRLRHCCRRGRRRCCRCRCRCPARCWCQALAA
jgi:hypothetical protein